MATMQQGDDMRDPRNQPDGSHDQDKHGRKQDSGTNAAPHRQAAHHDGGRDGPGGAARGGGSGEDRAGSRG